MSGLEAGSTLGGYRILARLRAGAMGVLYLARRMGPAGFARPVAIKVIHDHLAKNKRFCRMFITEAKLSARIDDPHVVRVEEFGEADGRYYLVMEFVHGVSLAQALGVLRRRGGIPVDAAVAIAMDVASGLHAAHEATDEEGVSLGIVHRDVSPHNVLVSYKGYVKVIDFGIAKAREGTGQTLTGSLRGKLAYMPPEQARSAKHVDRRADIYALGLVTWEMLVGRRMFDAKSDIALLNQIKNPVIVPPSGVNPRVPAELDAVVLKMLAQEPERRPDTAAQVARMLADACPSATRVLSADLAAVLEEVRDAATVKGEGGGEDDASEVYGEEVRKGLTIFGRSMHESVGLADGVLEGLESARDVSGHETEVMTKPPVSLKDTLPPQPAPPPAPRPSAPSVIIDEPEETTRRFGAVARHPRPTGNLVRTVVKPDNPYLQKAAPARGGGPMPAWVTPPVMILAPITVALAVALVVVQCDRRGDAPVAAAPAAAPSVSSTAPLVLADPVPAPQPVPAPVPVPLPASSPEQAPDHEGAPAPAAHTVAAARPSAAAPSRYDRAREAALAGDPTLVRQLLEARVRSGHGTPEEARLVRAACKQMGDTNCAEDAARYSSATTP